jgi:hypothetical protein
MTLAVNLLLTVRSSRIMVVSESILPSAAAFGSREKKRGAERNERKRMREDWVLRDANRGVLHEGSSHCMTALPRYRCRPGTSNSG